MDQSITEILAQRILILDGGLGTMIQAALDQHPHDGCCCGCNDVLCVDHPDLISSIHEQYLQAGADIITTNSFNSNAISLADYGWADRAYEFSLAAAQIARKAADKYSTPDKPRFVAGSVGPTNRTLSMSADVNSPASREITFPQLVDAYLDQMRGLIDGGVDLLLIETVFDTLNAKAAIFAARQLSPTIPLIISGTISDASGRTLSGQTVEALCASVAHANPLAVGLNCGYGAKHLLPYLERLAAATDTYVSVHPNAGLPNINGGYDETPEMFAADMEEYLRRGIVNIAGGCCGTTPDHIAALAKIAAVYKPPQKPAAAHITTLSGLEPLRIVPETNFVNVGERTNVAGSAKFARLIREGDYAQALSIARNQVEAGAQIIDICMDAAMIDAPAAMTHFLNLISSEPDIAKVPIMIDSSDWQALEAGLRCVQGKSVVNSISLKEGEDTFLSHADSIRRYGAAAVVMLFDEKGQADTFDRKIEVAKRAYDLLTANGFPPEDIIFDPNILAVATGIEAHDRYAKDFIDATRWIKQHLPHTKVSGGVSNLSFSFRGNNPVRQAMHSVFLYHAIAAGMDMAIVNPAMLQVYAEIEPELLERVEDVILCRRPDATDRLIEFASSYAAAKDTAADTAKKQDAWLSLSPRERVAHAMLKGITDHIEADILAIKSTGMSPIAIIDEILMPAMANVGELFAQGKMFLPQVVKSARVMKEAVGVLTPFIEQDKSDSAAAGKVVLATVKGDVHDIGKNIVGVVLTCNGFVVHDLGVMVDTERIVDEAEAIGADAICLSGLITPSLDEMIKVVKEASRRGLSTPVIVGGATTSDIHTAVKIAPETSAPVIRSHDAADNCRILAALTGPDRDSFVAKLKEEQANLRRRYEAEAARRNIIPLEEARANRPHFAVSQSGVGARNFDFDTVVANINWSFFFSSWGIPGTHPAVFDHPERGEEAKRIYADAQVMLPLLKRDLELRAAALTLPARADNDDIVVTLADGTERRLPMLRNQTRGDEWLCCSDFIGDSTSEITLFALSAGFGLDRITADFREKNDDYSAFMAKLLTDRLTEAFAETVYPDGCRIAFGYPAAPDHSLKRDVFDIINAEATGMTLTDSYMIVPAETICGIVFPVGKYFSVGIIGDDQLADYAARRGTSIDTIKHLIPNNIL